MNVRFGLMILGQTLTGKSTSYRVLEKALNNMKKRGECKQGAESTVLNPKSITMDELYGKMNPDTQEWKNGLASQIISNYAKKEVDDMRWVIFDGPIDAIWIENMNTVLDDNMTLCLSNGERIKLKHEMRMIFEIDDLSGASPATVSRCGMVYAAAGTLNWRMIVYKWIDQLDSKVFT